MTVSGPAGNDGEAGRRTTASSSQRSEVGSEHGEERRGAGGASAVRMGPLLEIGSFGWGTFLLCTTQSDKWVLDLPSCCWR